MENTVDIDSMPKEELEASLLSAVNDLDGKADAEPAEEPEFKPEPVEEEAAPAPKADTAEDSPKGDEGEDDGEDEGNPYRKRINRLLRKRDTLAEENSAKDAEIARLKKQLEEGENEFGEKPETDLPATINRVLDERENKSKTEIEQQKANDTEFEKLTKIAPDAFKRKSEIYELAKQYPTLTFEAIDRILAPADHVDPIEVNRKNAKRLDPGSLSRADLESEKDMNKASPAEQEKYLREQIAAGKLIV